MNKAILKVTDTTCGVIDFGNGYIELGVPKRSLLLKGMNPKEGEIYELTLEKVKKKVDKKPVKKIAKKSAKKKSKAKKK